MDLKSAMENANQLIFHVAITQNSTVNIKTTNVLNIAVVQREKSAARKENNVFLNILFAAKMVRRNARINVLMNTRSAVQKVKNGVNTLENVKNTVAIKLMELSGVLIQKNVN